MANSAKKRTGRPPTGNTELIWGRVPLAISAMIEARAEELAIPKARVVGALLEFALAHENEVSYPQPAKGRRDQQELPLTKAS